MGGMVGWLVGFDLVDWGWASCVFFVGYLGSGLR
jgi:hypothetical protein